MTYIGRLAIFVAAAAIGAGCATTRKVARPLSPESVAEINEAAVAGGNRPLEIDFHQPDRWTFAPAPVQAKALLPEADAKQTSFVDLGGERRSIESARVRGVHVTNRGSGALRGLGIGALAGGAAGIMFGATSSDRGYIGKDETMVIGGALLAAVGAAIGLIVGTSSGGQTFFVFD
jgi:hypothetical protein